MLMHNKRSGNIVIKVGSNIVTFKSNSILDIDKDAADRLAKMYPGMVVPVDAEKEASDAETEESASADESGSEKGNSKKCSKSRK